MAFVPLSFGLILSLEVVSSKPCPSSLTKTGKLFGRRSRRPNRAALATPAVIPSATAKDSASLKTCGDGT